MCDLTRRSRVKRTRTNRTYRAHVTRQSLRTRDIYYDHRYGFKVARRSRKSWASNMRVCLFRHATFPGIPPALDTIIKNNLSLTLTSINPESR